MENDPDFLEKVAREEFGMVRPGEYLYRIKRPVVEDE
jgi:cell division protein FtsB